MHLGPNWTETCINYATGITDTYDPNAVRIRSLRGGWCSRVRASRTCRHMRTLHARARRAALKVSIWGILSRGVFFGVCCFVLHASTWRACLVSAQVDRGSCIMLAITSRLARVLVRLETGIMSVMGIIFYRSSAPSGMVINFGTL